MFHPALVSDDVSPLEANLDRMYWSSLLSGRMMPGLGLATSRAKGTTKREKALLDVDETEKPVGKVRGRGRIARLS